MKLYHTLASFAPKELFTDQGLAPTIDRGCVTVVSFRPTVRPTVRPRLRNGRKHLAMENAIRTYSKDQSLVSLRRTHIARCAARVLALKGHDRATVRDIAQACGMGAGTLYHYVSSKADIVYLVAEHGMIEVSKSWRKIFSEGDSITATEVVRRAFRAHCEAVDSHQDLVLVLYREIARLDSRSRRLILEIEMELAAEYEKLLTRGCDAGEFSIQDIAMTAHNILVVAHMWAVRRWFFRGHCTLEEYITRQTQMILKSISAEFSKE